VNEAIARAASALAIWKHAGDQASRAAAPSELPTAKAREAQAHEEFIHAAYAVAFDLCAYLYNYVQRHDDRIVTKNEVAYAFATDNGGFILQLMDLGPSNPGVPLRPDVASAENFLQLMIDLPELLETLGVK
jgi:hypothetical protein